MKNTDTLTLKSIFENPNITRKVLDLCADGLMIVDHKGIITYVNKSFEEIHAISRETAIGQHVTKVIENTRMHIVAWTGMPELDKIQTIKGKKIVVSRIPIIENSQCIGAVGKIEYLALEKVKDLTRSIFKLEKSVRNGKLKKAETCFTFNDIVAVCSSSQNLKKSAMLAASSNSAIVLSGESGVGKEVFAQSIHAQSYRCTGPFIRVDCSAVSDDHFDFLLFGSEEKAAAATAREWKTGKFELADTGTIFLDKIGEMSLKNQTRLLRAIQEKEIDTAGSGKMKNVDVRIISATNKDLDQLVKKGEFRKDLFYRLNVIPISIPPLRERRADIPELTQLIWEDLKKENGIYYKSLDQGALAALCAHDWPGNIRELRNLLERALILVLKETITADHIQPLLCGQSHPHPAVFPSDAGCDLKTLLERTEKTAISEALVSADNNRCRTAKKLGISRALLYKRLHYYGLFTTPERKNLDGCLE